MSPPYSRIWKPSAMPNGDFRCRLKTRMRFHLNNKQPYVQPGYMKGRKPVRGDQDELSDAK